MTLTIHTAGVGVSLEVAGGVHPFTVEWGDGQVDAKRSRIFGHNYSGPGVRHIVVRDGAGARTGSNVEVL